MRLIDADEVKSSLLTELLIGVDGGTDASYLKTYEVIDRIEKIVNEWVDNQTTVEAIPIEWLVRKYEENITIWKTADTVDESFRASDIAMAIELITELWEKENDKETEEMHQ